MASPEADLLSNVLTYLKRKNEVSPNPIPPALVSTNPIVQAVASAAHGILATASPNFARLSNDAPMLIDKLHGFAKGHLETWETAHPQVIAAVLLWADTWKHGS